jgi:hypothetical protein
MTYKLTQDLLLAGTISQYLTSAMVDNYSNGNKSLADQQAIDSSIIDGMIMCLNFYNLNGEDTGFTQTILDDISNIIHQYDGALLLDVRSFAVSVGYDATALGAVNPIVYLKSGTVLPTPHTFIWTVTSDGQTVFPVLPFNISVIDPDSVILTLNDADPISGTDFSISGTTLTWTGTYPLSAGWKFEIKYWQ